MAAWVGRTAVEIAAAVRAGDASACDVAAGHLDRIGKLNAELGAFVRVRSAQALREAGEVDQRADRGQLRLAGVPVAIKDNLPVGGEPMRSGSAAAADVPQGEDHPVVARLRAAGAVVVGMTNLPELGIYPLTDSAFGIARNRPPGDSDRERLQAALRPFFDRHDVLVMPTLARPCPAARRWGDGSWLRSVITSLTYAPMAGIWNLAGFPAAAVPTASTAGGLPGSVQLVAAPGGESVLLALAAQLERARGWPRHAPAYTRAQPSAPA